MTRRAVVATIAVAVLGSLVLLVGTGFRDKPRLAGTNGVDAGSFTVALEDGESFCQENQFVPADADRMEMVIGTAGRPTPPIAITITDSEGRQVLRTRAPGGYTEGIAHLPLGRTNEEPIPAARVCVEPVGTKVLLGGFENAARIAYLRPGSESYWDIVPQIVHRFALGKPAWFGAWTLVVAVGLIVLLWVLCARVLFREVERP